LDDLTISALVATGSAVAVALIFLVVGRRQRARSRALDEYCRLHGYALRAESGPREKRLSIMADSWSLTTRMRGSVNESTSGSSEWSRETVWEDAKPAPDRPSFALMAPAPSADWDTLPVWARELALKVLGCELPGAQDALNSARILQHETIRCLVFESEPTATEGMIRRLLPHLVDWPADAVLYMACSPAGARLRVVNLFADSPAMVERIIAVGMVLRS